jgi:plastocyanin domain-containing protein
MFERIFGNGKNAASGQLEIQVTERGFEPARIRVTRDEAITLVVTRKIERTCAREFVLDELGIHEALPVGKAVTITFTPRKSGPMKFGCAMGKMISGVIDVV